MRIHGGKGAYEGNIEILDGKTWHHICKEGFNMDAAKVICRTLGFPDRYILFYAKDTLSK